MSWGDSFLNARLARRVPEGGLRSYLETPPQPGPTPLSEALLLAVDLETTGLDAATDRIVSVGMVDVDGASIPLGSTATHVVAGTGPVGQSAVIHTLTDDAVAAGVAEEEALDALFSRLAGRTLLAHHAAIETGFLRAAVKRRYGVGIRIPAIDTIRLGQRLLGTHDDQQTSDLRLWRLRSRLGLPTYRGHDAEIDALACAELYLALVAHLRLGELRTALRMSS